MDKIPFAVNKLAQVSFICIVSKCRCWELIFTPFSTSFIDRHSPPQMVFYYCSKQKVKWIRSYFIIYRLYSKSSNSSTTFIFFLFRHLFSENSWVFLHLLFLVHCFIVFKSIAVCYFKFGVIFHI